MGEEVAVTPVENNLPSVVLRNGAVSFVYSYQSERTKPNDIVVQVEALPVDKNGILPLVKPGREENGLPLIECEADLSLLNNKKASITVYDRVDTIALLLPYGVERVTDQVVSDPVEVEVTSSVADRRDVAFGHGESLHHAGAAKARQCASKAVEPGRGVGGDSVDIFGMLKSIRVIEKAMLLRPGDVGGAQGWLVVLFGWVTLSLSSDISTSLTFST